MNIREVRRELKKAAQSPRCSQSGPLMVAVEIDGERVWFAVTEVSTGGHSAEWFPTLIAGERLS